MRRSTRLLDALQEEVGLLRQDLGASQAAAARDAVREGMASLQRQLDERLPASDAAIAALRDQVSGLRSDVKRSMEDAFDPRRSAFYDDARTVVEAPAPMKVPVDEGSPVASWRRGHVRASVADASLAFARDLDGLRREVTKTHEALSDLVARRDEGGVARGELDEIQRTLAEAHGEATRRHDDILATLRSAPTSAPDFGALRRDLRDAHAHAADQRERLLVTVQTSADDDVHRRELRRFEAEATARHDAVMARLADTPVVAPEALALIREDVASLKRDADARTDALVAAAGGADARVAEALKASHAILAARYEAMEARRRGRDATFPST